MVQAVEFPAVTTASGDYHPPSSNWFLGPESLLLAIGKVASKDGINTGGGPNHEGRRDKPTTAHTDSGAYVVLYQSGTQLAKLTGQF